MKTDSAALKAAYKKKAQAINTAAGAAEEELVAQEKELQRDTQSALQNAYIENVRAAQRSGQLNRAAGITGGQAVAADISRQNQYGAARTDLQLNRETGLQQINMQRTLNRANTEADVASNDLSLQSDLMGIAQTDRSFNRSRAAELLSIGYVPQSAAETQQLADALGIPVESVRALIANQSK